MNYDYKVILEALKEIIATPGFYFQTFIITACFVAASLIYKALIKYVGSKIKSSPEVKHPIYQKANKYLPLSLYVLIIICLLAGMVISSIVYHNDDWLFLLAIQLIILFLLVRLIKVFFESPIIATLIAILLLPVIVLNSLGLLNPALEYLNHHNLKLGSLEISIYTIIKASLILLTVFWLAGLISKKLKFYIAANNTIRSNTKGVLNKVIDIITYFIIFMITLRVLGVDLTTFAVIGGAIGVGISFGLQKIASNFISGIILLFEKSVEVGDMIELDNGNITGIISRFGGFHTLIEVADGREIMVPNEDFITNRVTNWTYNNNRAKIEIKIKITYGSDLKKARDLMIQAAKDHPRSLSYPGAECYINDFLENGAELSLQFWISNILEGKSQPKSDILFSIWHKFKDHQIEIASPPAVINLNRPVA